MRQRRVFSPRSRMKCTITKHSPPEHEPDSLWPTISRSSITGFVATQRSATAPLPRHGPIAPPPPPPWRPEPQEHPYDCPKSLTHPKELFHIAWKAFTDMLDEEAIPYA